MSDFVTIGRDDLEALLRNLDEADHERGGSAVTPTIEDLTRGIPQDRVASPNAANVRNHQRLLQEERNRSEKLRRTVVALRKGLEFEKRLSQSYKQLRAQDHQMQELKDQELAGSRATMSEISDENRQLKRKLARSERLREEGK